MKEKILHLTLKKKWFDMIRSGEKKEEYREIKAYWSNRFYYFNLRPPYKFTHIRFKNGYSKNAPEFLIELKKIKIGLPKKKWHEMGHNKSSNKRVFVLILGEIVIH